MKPLEKWNPNSRKPELSKQDALEGLGTLLVILVLMTACTIIPMYLLGYITIGYTQPDPGDSP